MKLNLALLLVGLLLGPSLRAAEGSANPTVAQVLERYVEATGGREVLGKLRSRVMKGTIEVTVMGAGGAYVAKAKAPNRQTSTLEFAGFGSIREGYDGKVAWSSLPLQGPKAKTGGDLARVQRTTVFPRELRLAEAYERLEVKGAAQVGGVDAWELHGSVKGGKPDRLYFAQKEGLLLREEATVPTAMGEMTFQIDFEDYRVVDGVKVAHRMKVPQPPEMGFLIQFSEVKHNVELADSEFAMPTK